MRWTREKPQRDRTTLAAFPGSAPTLMVQGRNGDIVEQAEPSTVSLDFVMAENPPIDVVHDSRIAVRSNLASDMPAHGELPAHRKGALVTLAKMTRTPSGKLISYTFPSTTAMSLRIARSAELRALEAHPKIRYVVGPSPFGTCEGIHSDDETLLYDYFSDCMIAVTFGFQAIEAFLNEVIGRKLVGTFPFAKTERKVQTVREMTILDIERSVSMDDKISQILPKLLHCPSVKSAVIWSRYSRIRKLRNDIIHPKFAHQRPQVRGLADLKNMTVFDRFLVDGVAGIPVDSLNLIYHFAKYDIVHEWLESLLLDFGIVPSH